MLRFALFQMAATLLVATPALAVSPAEQRGKTFAPLKIAPPFRTLHNRYPIETLEGFRRGHLYRASDDAGVPASILTRFMTCSHI